MKKKLLSLVVVGVLSLGLIGCETGYNDTLNGDTVSLENSRFKSIGDVYLIGYNYRVYVDSKTNIVYLSCAGGLSVMYNSERQPMTLDEYNKTK